MRPLLLVCLAVCLAACATAAPTPTESPWEPLPTLPPTTPLAAGLLIDYTVEGGVAFNRVSITVRQDGAAHLTNAQYSGALNWTVPADALGRLKSLLLNTSLAFLESDPAPDLACADCYIYTVNALTPQGVKTLHFSEAAFSQPTPVSPRYRDLVDVMTAIINTAPGATLAAPTATPLPFPTLTAPPQTPLPARVLIVFVQEGGIAFTRKTVTLQTDGSARLEDTSKPGPVNWTISDGLLSELRDLLASPQFAALPYSPHNGVNCSDCFIMKAEALTPSGQKSLMFSQADIDFAPDTPPQYAVLLNLMADVIRSASGQGQIPTATSPYLGSGQPATAGPRTGSLPDDVLLIYNREGGFAYSNRTLTIRLNGAAVLTDSNVVVREFSLQSEELATLNQLLADLQGAAVPGGVMMCADCYVYTLTARAPGGVMMVKTNEAAFSPGQFKAFQAVLNLLALYLP